MEAPCVVVIDQLQAGHKLYLAIHVDAYNPGLVSKGGNTLN